MSYVEYQDKLLELAKLSIHYSLTHGKAYDIDISKFPKPLQEQRASFVTLNLNGQLRGCIGSLVATKPLCQDICHNAYQAANADPRFPPVTKEEFTQLDIHISILTPAVPLEVSSQEDLIAKLQPGIDGIILELGRHRGTFLPSVWEQLPDPVEFVRHLKRKAGIPNNYWANDIKVWRYETESLPAED